jgi:hypothetical protein
LDSSFFFVEANREIRNKFSNLYKRAEFDAIKAGIEQLNEGFGWYLTIKQIAESGIFNRPDATPMRSAELANLYEAYTYLSSVAAENDYQKRYQDVLMNKR